SDPGGDPHELFERTVPPINSTPPRRKTSRRLAGSDIFSAISPSSLGSSVIPFTHIFGCVSTERERRESGRICGWPQRETRPAVVVCADDISADRKSTRLNSSHVSISYAVFCLKKKIQDKAITS